MESILIVNDFFHKDKYENNNIKDTIVIGKNGISFLIPDEIVGYDYPEEIYLSNFPFDEILNFLIDVERSTFCGPMQMIKRFPKKIMELFEKWNIEYDVDDNTKDYIERKVRKGTFDEEKYFLDWLKENNLKTYDLLKTTEEKYFLDWLKKSNVEIYSQKIESHIFNSPFYSIFY